MSEFKVTSGVDTQISAFKNAGSQLNNGFAATDSANVSTLSTAMAAIAEQTAIRKLLVLYAELIAKDAADLAEMAETARQADRAASGAIKT